MYCSYILKIQHNLVIIFYWGYSLRGELINKSQYIIFKIITRRLIIKMNKVFIHLNIPLSILKIIRFVRNSLLKKKINATVLIVSTIEQRFGESRYREGFFSNNNESIFGFQYFMTIRKQNVSEIENSKKLFRCHGEAKLRQRFDGG